MFRHTSFTSRFLQGERDVSVYVPPGYEEQTERQYPLLILQDGQNLFDPETSFIRGKTWRVAESADDAIDAGEVEPLVIAGVANAGERRLAEYTPSRDMKLGGGDAGQAAENSGHQSDFPVPVGEGKEPGVRFCCVESRFRGAFHDLQPLCHACALA